MSTVTIGAGLRIDVARWPGCQVPQSELTAAFSFLAHKTGKSVRCSSYRGSVQYSSDVVHVYICTPEHCGHSNRTCPVKLGGAFHIVDPSQMLFTRPEVQGTPINDEEDRLIARVDHNCIIILIDITANDNEAGRAILAHVIEQAIPHLIFDVSDCLNGQRETIIKQYSEFHKNAIQSRLDTKTDEVQKIGRDAENFYYQLIQAERDLPLAQQELAILEKQLAEQGGPVIEKQSAGLLALTTNGQYEEVTPASDGSIFARTSLISIEHDGWTFDLGRYEINIDSRGKLTIFSSDGREAEGYPHPHIDSSGRPCLGNISADLAKAVGRMRMAEALTLLHDFLTSYNPDGPYIRIGRFDSEYEDPDDNPCDDCEDYHTPYCICECSHNDGNYSCSDCCEYRTDHCYQECSYNLPGFEYLSPCDPCQENEEHCYLECQYNQKWQLKRPCDDCKQECDECDYAEKKAELAARKKTAAA